MTENTAKWIYLEADECYICSNCAYSALNDYKGFSVDSAYCPHCGKRMINSTRESSDEVYSN